MKLIRQLISFLKKWLWDKPIITPQPKATDVLNQWICVEYKKQWVSLRKNELTAWNRMGRKDKRAMAKRFETLQKKGHLKFVEIKGKMICIKSKDYESKSEKL